MRRLFALFKAAGTTKKPLKMVIDTTLEVNTQYML